MDIVLDFDGTVVTHDYPRVGKDIGAKQTLIDLVKNGHNLILFTMRCDKEGNGCNYLQDAVKWFELNGIKLHGIQSNPTQKEWTTSPKAYGQLIIDDAALGCPLTYKPSFHDRPYVNWVEVRKILESMGVFI